MPPLENRSAPLTRRRLFEIGLGSVAFTQVAGLEIATAQEGDSYSFLVLGLDTREENTDQRSDTIMLARVDMGAGTVRTLSIPRDLYVEIPGYRNDKVNAAYQIGLTLSDILDWEVAAGVAVETIAHNFGVAIDGVALTDMNRFPAIVDAVGGIDVVNPYAFTDDVYAMTSFPAGQLHLDGDRALVYCRIRVPDGDGGRVMRQHLVLQALLVKLQEPDMLARLPALVGSLRDAVRTDIPPALQANLMTLLPNISSEDLAFTNIDHLLTPGYTAGGAWIYQADWSVLPGYVQSWLAGEAG